LICQIYSATTAAEASALIDAGTDFIGIFPVDDPEYRGFYPGDGTVGSQVGPAVADEVMTAVGARAVTVILSLANDPVEILASAVRFRPDVLHVSGQTFRADAAFRDELANRVPETKLMHVVEVRDATSSVAEAARLQDIADYLILDTGSDHSIGASGKTHDWAVSRQIVDMSRLPVILAGGLEPGNVADAVMAVRPWGVDSFSKTNLQLVDGSYAKDIDAVREFCREARKAEERAALAN
jgi:phosphoribosylanthranilate isomerase